jgi:catechol 2,3-dioxygenase-like lactoylglutathione lyase family enzyme
MKVNALDHVNIITADLSGSARFYADLLGLEIRNAPPPLTPETAQWLYDAAGRAIIHLNSLDCRRTYPRDVVSGPTGMIHHVALNCSGHAEVVKRLDVRGSEYRLNEVTAIGLRQIFVQDPNDVLLELNFHND